MITRNKKGQFVKGFNLGNQDGFKKGCISLNKTHGMSETRFYGIWTNVLTRCNNAKYVERHLYGGRGIKCLWKSFEEFRDDMCQSYLEHVEKFGELQTSIDRINNNGNYCKENCRWATQKIQQRNKRSNRLLTFQDKTLCIAGWADILGISYDTIYRRVFAYNWSIEKTLTTPVHFRQSIKFKRTKSVV